MKKIFIFLLAIFSVSVFSADLVKVGKPAAVIVLSMNPTRSARFAAAELNYHIEKMTGVKLPVTTAPQNGKTNIFVGASNGTPANDSFAKQEFQDLIYLCQPQELSLLNHFQDPFFQKESQNRFPV